MRRIIYSCILLLLTIFLVSCKTPLDTTIDEINQRYSDFKPMYEEDVERRFKNPLNQRIVSDTIHISIWVPNYDTIEEVRTDIEAGKEVMGVFVKFEEIARSFQRLNEETLEMEWYKKIVIEAVMAEKRPVTLSDLK